MSQGQNSSVVAILYPGCIFFELALVLELLAKDYQIVYATPDGLPHKASNGAIFNITLSYKEIDLQNAKAVLMPGGNPDSIKDNTDIDKVLSDAHQRGLLIAGICAGPSILAKAGILKGRTIAHGYQSAQLEFLKTIFEGVTLTDHPFVCDQNIITAKPDAHIDFAVEIACRLGSVDASKANRVKDYYRGILGKKIRPLALALIKNNKSQFLFHKSFDKKKGETFYRPLGGGIDFSELGKVAVEREIMEELSEESEVSDLVGIFENIFVYEGQPGHEIVMLYNVTIKNQAAYEKEAMDIYESGVVVGQGVWRSLAEMKSEGAKIYPLGLEAILAKA
jgi:putative intracellular protease/amidase